VARNEQGQDLKTRVLKRYDERNALNVYHVQSFDYYGDAEMRRYYPDKRLWQTHKIVRDEEEARDLAYRLASGCSTEQVIAEFGTE
jgi:hypothetical protein